ncbi:MAG: hypothetical protein K0R18_278 [Bacillales bacterium]|jgi:hypothetical protein|nr:hypothetical protein [Bacillales bacterium]
MEDKREQKKAEIIVEMNKYRDSNGNIDLTKFRQEMPKVYSRISYYFKSIDQALVEANGGGTAGAPINRMTLRNQLAYDYIKFLREEKKQTLEEIGNRYGVSRAHVNQLYQSLGKTFGHEPVEEEIIEEEAE